MTTKVKVSNFFMYVHMLSFSCVHFILWLFVSLTTSPWQSCDILSVCSHGYLLYSSKLCLLLRASVHHTMKNIVNSTHNRHHNFAHIQSQRLTLEENFFQLLSTHTDANFQLAIGLIRQNIHHHSTKVMYERLSCDKILIYVNVVS